MEPFTGDPNRLDFVRDQVEYGCLDEDGQEILQPRLTKWHSNGSSTTKAGLVFGRGGSMLLCTACPDVRIENLKCKNVAEQTIIS
jgi:hypothetical protein